MYLPKPEEEYWAVSDPIVAQIPLYWKAFQLLMLFNLSCEEYLSLGWRVDTQRGESSRSPKDIISQAEFKIPGLVKKNFTEHLSFFTFRVA